MFSIQRLTLALSGRPTRLSPERCRNRAPLHCSERAFSHWLEQYAVAFWFSTKLVDTAEK